MNLAIGDESTPGYNPRALNSRTKSKALSNALGEQTISDGRKGASITIKGKSNILHQIEQFSLPAYDRIFLFYGSNDYLYSNDSLITISKKLVKAIGTIRHRNRYVKIYGVLPLPMYDKKGHTLAEKQNQAGYTFKGLMDMLSITYANHYVKAINWLTMTAPIVNQHNYKQRLIGGRYPTKETYQRMSRRISDFVSSAEYHFDPRFNVASQVKDSKSESNDAIHFSSNNSKNNKSKD